MHSKERKIKRNLGENRLILVTTGMLSDGHLNSFLETGLA